jgi:hypothetical protein
MIIRESIVRESIVRESIVRESIVRESTAQMMAEVDDMVDGKQTDNAELIKKLIVP